MTARSGYLKASDIAFAGLTNSRRFMKRRMPPQGKILKQSVKTGAALDPVPLRDPELGVAATRLPRLALCAARRVSWC